MDGVRALRRKGQLPSGRRRFGWMALWIMLGGGALTFLMHLTRLDPDATGATRITMLVTVLLAGLCAIIASSER